VKSYVSNAAIAVGDDARSIPVPANTAKVKNFVLKFFMCRNYQFESIFSLNLSASLLRFAPSSFRLTDMFSKKKDFSLNRPSAFEIRALRGNSRTESWQIAERHRFFTIKDGPVQGFPFGFLPVASVGCLGLFRIALN
jgi:hypothetical protein